MTAKKIENLISEIITESNLRTKSFVITIFGDLVSLYGGSIALVHLVKLGELFGLNENLIRTSVYRMKQEKLLTTYKQGRVSLYSFSDISQLLFTKAEKKIYHKVTLDPLDAWTLVICNSIKNKKQKEKFRKNLIYQGFTALSSTVLFYPKKVYSPMEIARELNISHDVVIFRASLSKNNDFICIKNLIKDCWNLEHNVQLYQSFLNKFNKLKEVVAKNGKNISPQVALKIRLLMIHEYRRIILKDPFLPKELLLSFWPYDKSYQLCSNLYKDLYQLSCQIPNDIFGHKSEIHHRFN